MMDLHEAAKVLRAHQAWRKGGDGPQTDVTLLTQALDAAVAALEGLKDPAVVLVNMMRGTIANPHAETAARCDALAAENDRLRERLEGMAKPYWSGQGKPCALSDKGLSAARYAVAQSLESGSENEVEDSIRAAITAYLSEGMASAEPEFWYIPADNDEDEDALILPNRDGSLPSSYTHSRAYPLYAASQPAHCCAKCDTITERARELIGLHLSEQEGLRLPTGREYQRAVDALAQAIGASHQHPRERALHQDAKRGNFRYQQEDDGA